MKRSILLSAFILLSILSCTRLSAQYLEPRFGIYFTSPVGLLSKGGIKAEYRLNLQHSLLLGYTQYWGFFPGFQSALEYRMYWAARKSSAENFIYAKGGMGYADYELPPAYQNMDEFGDNRHYKSGPGTYFLGGGGFGRHISFDWFFIEFCGGLKFAEVASHTHVYNERLFYLTGPGAYADLNFHFGVQF